MMNTQKVVTREAWLEARKALLAEEKELTQKREALAARRRQLPWVQVEKPYQFEGQAGKVSLGDLFGARSQLVVYHFMFAPDWEKGCKSCSFWADNFNGITTHLAHRDVSFVAISRAPLPKLEAFAKRLGWSFPWLSSYESDFNFDYHVSLAEGAKAMTYNFTTIEARSPELPGISVFAKNAEGEVFHTYSCYARGLDMMNGAYQYLDLVPKGRDEVERPPMAWLRLHDEYAS